VLYFLCYRGTPHRCGLTSSSTHTASRTTCAAGPRRGAAGAAEVRAHPRIQLYVYIQMYIYIYIYIYGYSSICVYMYICMYVRARPLGYTNKGQGPHARPSPPLCAPDLDGFGRVLEGLDKLDVGRLDGVKSRDGGLGKGEAEHTRRMRPGVCVEDGCPTTTYMDDREHVLMCVLRMDAPLRHIRMSVLWCGAK
jgi:hypothetical protein